MSEPVSAFRFRDLVRGVPAPVWAITVLFGLLLSLHSVMTPLYRAPDEARHIDQVIALREGRGYPPPGSEVLGQEVLGSYWAAGYATAGPNGIGVPDPRTDIRTPLPLTGAKTPDLEHAPAFKDVPALQRPLDELNQMTQHPPGYYALGAAVLWVIPYDGDLPFPVVIGLLRLLSVACITPLPLLAFQTARRLGLPGAIAAAAVPLAVPELGEIGSAVNNDNLLTLMLSLLTVALTFVATGDLTRKTAVKVGLISAIALFTKAFALAAMPWIVIAYLVPRRSRAALTGVVIAGATSLLGGWWYVVNVLRYGSLQSEQTISDRYTEQKGFSPSLHAYASEVAHKLPERFWGNFGILEVPLPQWFTWSATLALLGLLLLGVLTIRPRVAGLTLLSPLVFVPAILVAGTYGLYAKYAIFPGLQGRYLFPALAAMSVLVACGLSTVFRRFAPLAALVAALAFHLYGAHVELSEIWGNSLSTMAAWAWWPVWVVYAVLAAIAVAAVAAVGLTATSSARPRSGS